MKVVKKTEVFEAEEFNVEKDKQGNWVIEGEPWTLGAKVLGFQVSVGDAGPTIFVGGVVLGNGDYIVTDAHGNKRGVKRAEFEKTYETA